MKKLIAACMVAAATMLGSSAEAITYIRYDTTSDGYGLDADGNLQLLVALDFSLLLRADGGPDYCPDNVLVTCLIGADIYGSLISVTEEHPGSIAPPSTAQLIWWDDFFTPPTVVSDPFRGGGLLLTEAESPEFPAGRIVYQGGMRSFKGLQIIETDEVLTTGFTISNVVVRELPEPASWAMMIGGFALAGAAMRRRSRSALRPVVAVPA